MSTRALEALDRILDRGGEADEVLREVVRVLAAEPEIAWAAIAFLDDGELVVGPEAGAADDTRRRRLPVIFRESKVGELWIDGEAEEAFLERVVLLVSAHVLLGWDTRGETWEP